MSQALIEQWRQEDAGEQSEFGGSNVRAAFVASENLDSTKVAESLRLAKSLGMPETVVQERPDWAKQEAKARTVEKSPLLAHWAEEDRTNAAFTRDDPEALLDIFESIQADRRDNEAWERQREALHGVIKQAQISPLEQIPTLLREGLDQVGKGLGGFVSGLARVAGNGTFTDSEGNEQNYSSAVLNKLADHVENSLQAVDKKAPAPLQAQSTMGGYAQDLMRQVPQLASQILATATTGPLGGMSFMGSRIAGGQYLDLTGKGVAPGRALAAGLANAAMQAPLEQIGLGKFMGIFKATGGKAILKKALEGTGTEAFTEYLQEYPESATDIWAQLQKTEGVKDWLERFVSALPETHKKGLYSAAVAAPFGLLGGIGKASYDAAKAREATHFMEQQQAIHAKVEATQIKSLSPSHLESALVAAGMRGNVSLPADAVVELYQSEIDIMTPLGWKPEDVAEAADMGQTLDVPLSRLHAVLDQPQFEAVAQIMKRSGDSPSVADAANLKGRIAEDAERIAAQYNEYAAEQGVIDAEKERIRGELASAVASVPNLKVQAESQKTNPESTAADYAELILRWAERRQARSGVPVVDSLRKYNAQGLVLGEYGQLVTPEQAMAQAQEQAQIEAVAPFWDAVWGRLDGKSLRADYPQAYRELTRRHGPKLFGKGGLAPDLLADELERLGLQEQGGGADALIERLKTLGGTRRGTLFQDETDSLPSSPEENAARGIIAMNRVITEHVDELNAMYRPEVGGISFYWGTPGKGARMKGGSGVSHLIARRNAEGMDGESVARKMVDVLAYGVVGEEYGPEGGQHRNVSYDGHTAVLSLYRFGKRETWLLTGWKDYSAGENDTVNVSNPTQTSPSGIRDKLGAAESSSERIKPLGSDGKPLFQKLNHGKKSSPRASITPVSDGYLVQLYKKADLSSILHETGHFFLMEMEEDIRANIADAATQADYATLRDWLGATEGAELTREQHEKFARGFEAYLREGKAPSQSLEGIFARFKKWLIHIYKQAAKLNVELTDDVRGVFDRLLTTEAEVNARAVENGLVDLSVKELDALGLKGADRVYASDNGLTAEQSAVDAEMERIKGAFATSMTGVPGLVAQAESQKTNPESTAPDYAELILHWAERRQARSGVPVVESLRKYKVGGAIGDGRIASLTENPLEEAGGQLAFQPSIEEVRTAEENLKADVKAWGQAVDAIDLRKLPPSPVRMLRQTPLVMQLLGSDAVTSKAAAQGGIYAAPHLFDGKHSNMTRDMWKQIPASMADPIAIFDSDSAGGRAQGDLVFMLEVKDANGATVVVPVVLDVKAGRKQAHINIAKSAYAKEKGGVPSNTWFLSQVQKNARYVNGQKMKRWLRAAGTNLPLGPQQKGLAASNVSGKTIFTEVDLVKLRTANPGMYQDDDIDLESGTIEEKARRLQRIVASIKRGIIKKTNAVSAIQAAKNWITAHITKPIQTIIGDVTVDASSVQDSLSHTMYQNKLDAVQAIENVLKDGVFLGQEKDWSGKPINNYYFAGKVDFDGEEKIVFVRTRQAEGRNNRFYVHEVFTEEEIKKVGAMQTGTTLSSRVPGNAPTFYRKLIAEVLNVKSPDDVPGTLNHGRQSSPRASITPVSDGYLIQLYKKADLSSILHETGHFFLMEMEEDIRANIADAATQADYATLRDWLGATEGAELTREQHEQFARGFEAYLREGKAPSQSLEGIFARFKKWLIHIYKQAAKLNVELTDDVRGVFDRLLATEAEVNARAVENGLVDLSVKELDALGLKGADRVYASGLMKAARDAAAIRLQEDRDRKLKTLRVQWAREAREALDRDPVYLARKDLRAEGLDIDAVREEFGDDFAAELRQAVPTSLRKGGADPEIFAAQHGFESAADMLLQVKKALPVGKAVSAMVEERQALHDTQYDAAEYLVETNEASEQMALVGKYLAKHSGSRDVEQEAVARVAAEKLAAMPVGKAMQSGVFRQAMRRALEAERRAIAKGDFAAALEANHKARLNLEFTRQALQIKRDAETLQGAIKRFTGMRRIDPDARFIVGDTAQRHGLIREEREKTLFQDGDGQNGPVIVSGDELGVPEGAPLKEYQKAARAVYRELQKKSAQREDLGEIRFSGAGFKKAQQASADPRKWQLFSKLKEIIERAEYIRRNELTKTRSDDIIAFHWLETDVELDGQPLRVGVQVGEDSRGNKFYNLNHDVEAFKASRKEAPGVTQANNLGDQELHQDALAPLEENISSYGDGVNLRILEPEQTVFRSAPSSPGDALPVRDASTIRKWIGEVEADGYSLFVDEAVLYGPGKPWRELNGTEFENLAETVNQIITVERNRRQLLTAQGKADLDDVADEIAASVAGFRAAEPIKTVERENAAIKMLGNLHAVHTKIESLCLALDGGRPGPVWEHIYRPITKAEDNQSLRFKAAREALRDLFGTYSRKELSRMCLRRDFVESIGEKLTWENRLAVALNMGNEANISRLREGHSWTDAQIADVLSPLQKRDWDFVQSLWDYLETFREESFKLQEDVTGLQPKAVAAKPLLVRTADGHELTLRGGYYPIKYNAEKGFRAFQHEQAAMDKELFGGRNYGAAQTRQGHLKERAKGGTGEPLLLELAVVTDHVFNVIHDLAYRRAVLDVAKVLRHKKVREALRDAVGMERVDQFDSWLTAVANERQEPMQAVHRMANWARSASTIMPVGFKVSTLAMQSLGITQSVKVLGGQDMAAGFKKVYANPLRLSELLEETFARSPMMAQRIRIFDQEMQNMAKKLMPTSGLFGWVDLVRDSAFVPLGIFQMGVDLPTWWGGYIKGLRDLGGDEMRAAEYADSIVHMNQSNGASKDLTRVQCDGSLLRLTSLFYSYFSTFYNLAARRFTGLQKDHSPAAVFRTANIALLLWFVPALFSEQVVGNEAGDDENKAKWTAMNSLQCPFQAVLAVRELETAVFAEYAAPQSASTSLAKWFKSVNKALEEENVGRIVKPSVEAAGYLFGLPLKQSIITVGNIWDYLTGEDPDFYVRDLFFVKPMKRR